MKNNKLKNIVVLLGTSGLLAASAFADGLDTTAATVGITDAVSKGTVIVVAGFGISVLFMVARVIKRGMGKAG